VLAELAAACELLGDAIGHVDPCQLSGIDCAAVVESLARTEKRCAALRVLAAARAAQCDAHKDRGYSNPARWLADTSGITTGEAKTALDTANRLDACPLTKEALLAGGLSLTQAGEITKTEVVVAGSETALLELAATTSVNELRETARRQRLEAQDPKKRHERQRQEQFFRHSVDDNGMVRLSGLLSPEIGVPVVNRIDAETDRLFRKTHREGEAEPRDRLAADALAALILDARGPGEGKPQSRRAEVVLVCDISAFQRGHTEPGEVCHVIGGGPVPVSVAVEMATASFIKAVLHNGTRIETVAHFGRYLNAKLRTALDLGDPPLFTGAKCVDCGRRYGLEWDHVDPVAHQGPTCYDNLRARCWPCHQEKTRRDREAGLLTPCAPNTADPPGPGQSTGPTPPPPLLLA
jgi:hypothetical protein